MTTALVNVDRAKAYLQEKAIPFTDVTQLSGGFANWTYRVTQSDGPGLILKHTSVIVKDIPTLQAPVARADIEARALTVVPPLLRDVGANVHPPTLLSYDAVAHVQQQLPAGVRTLKDAYTDSSLDIAAIGRRMGMWLAALHAIPLPADRHDDSVARQLFGGSYRGCSGVLERWGLDPTYAERAKEKYEPLLKTENQFLCHGDFWTGNVLLPDGDDASPRLTIVDWEMCRGGNGACDIGQFAAEAWLLDNHRPNRHLLPAFLNGYCETAGSWLTAEYVQRATVHCGIHLAYWPSMVEWADTDGTKKIIEHGADLIKGAEEGGREWLEKSDFGVLLKA